MDMTSEQLRWMREQRDMTREELANYLGDCTASTVNKWERGINPVPSWVADKMFSKLPITFTVQDLAEMYELCREEHCTMTELIQDSVHAALEERRQNKTLDATKNSQLTGKVIHLPQSKVAEDPTGYKAPPKKTGTQE
jgi:transcriptional regulator with XRE-family HTH domain